MQRETICSRCDYIFSAFARLDVAAERLDRRVASRQAIILSMLARLLHCFSLFFDSAKSIRYPHEAHDAQFVSFAPESQGHVRMMTFGNSRVSQKFAISLQFGADVLGILIDFRDLVDDALVVRFCLSPHSESPLFPLRHA